MKLAETITFGGCEIKVEYFFTPGQRQINPSFQDEIGAPAEPAAVDIYSAKIIDDEGRTLGDLNEAFYQELHESSYDELCLYAKDASP
jgi:hypothetical protein